MKIAKRLISITLAMIMAFSVFSIAITAEEYIGVHTMELVLEKDGNVLGVDDTLAPGDVFDVTLKIGSDYNCGSSSYVILYDNTYFQPARDGQPYTFDDIRGPEAVEDEADLGNAPESAFYTMLEKEVTTGYQYKTTCFSIGGHVNVDKNTNIGSVLYYPQDWQMYTDKPWPVVKSEYNHIDYLMFLGNWGVSAPAGGATVILDPPEPLIKFSMMIKEDAPATSVGESARFWIDEGCEKQTYFQTGKIYMNKVIGIEPIGTGMDYQYINCDYNFVISDESVAEYTVDFNLNGGTGTAPASVSGAVGTDVTLPAVGNIAKEGYSFLGWATTSNATEALSSYAIPEGGATLYAVYAVNNYTITYMVDGSEYDSVTYDYGETVTAPSTDPVKTGYTFSGWSGLPATMPAGNLEVTAQFNINSYTITYMVDGSEYDSDTYDYGEAVTAPSTDPVKTGYTFSGWSGLPATMPAEDVTATAVFSVNEFKVTYMIDGTEYGFDMFNYGETVTASVADPVKTGYTFAGWDGLPSTMPAENIVVTAQFNVNTFTVTFYADGDVYQIDSYEFGAVVAPPVIAPEKTGYTFTGWDAVPATMPNEDVAVTAQFAVNQYTITFKADGSADIVITQDYGTSITAPAVPEKEGFTGNWDVAVPATMPAENLTINASYTAKQVGYTVKHYCENLEGSFELVDTANLTQTTGAQATATANTYEGFTFDADLSTTTGTVLGDGSLELSAYYTRNEYNFLYMDGGTQLYSNTFKYGQQFALPINPEKAEHIFLGWLLGENSFVAPETVPAYGESTITLTANFVEEGSIGDYSGVIAALAKLPNEVNKKFYTVEAEGWIDDAHNYPNNLYDQLAIDAIEQDILDLCAELLRSEYKDYYIPVIDDVISKNHWPNRDESRAEIKYTLTPDTTGALQPGDEVTIVLSLQSNFVVSSGVNIIMYDSNYFEPASYEEWGELNYEYGLVESGPFRSPRYDGNTINMNYARKYYPVGPLANYRDDDDYFNRYKVALMVYVKTATGTGHIPIDDSPLSYLTLKVKDTAPDGVATVQIDEAWRRTITHDNDLYVVRGTGTSTKDALNGYDEMALYGQTFDLSDAYLEFTIGEEEEYTVDFDLNGGIGTTPSSVTGAGGTEVTLPAVGDIAKEGHTFLGWAETSDATEALASYTIPTDGATLYAIYAINEYTITYIADGSEYQVDAYDFGATVTAPADPEKTGYTFTGWDAIPATMPAENIVVTAQFAVNEYTITYIVDPASAWEVQTYNYGETVTAPADPEKTGYTFTGWDIEIPETMPAENLEATAQFAVNEYTITYVVDGSEYQVDTLDFGATVTAPADPEKTGYTFTGWDGLPATMPAENVEVTAQFAVNEYTITFKAEGSEDIVITQNFGTAVTAPEVPARTGYTGVWDTEVPATMPAADMTINAVYTAIGVRYTVEYYCETFVSGDFALETSEEKSANTGESVNAEIKSFTGFSFDSGASTVSGTVAGDGSLVLKAYYTRNSYSITYIVDASTYESLSYLYGEEVVALAVPEKSGFTGAWDAVEPANMPANNLTFTAVYTEIPDNSHDAIFMVDGEVYATVPTEEGAQIIAPADPIKEGFRFTGWEPEVGVMGDEDMVFHATFGLSNILSGGMLSRDLAALVGATEDGNYYGGVENLYIKVKGSPQKLQLICKDGTNNTYTYDRVINSQVLITSFDEDGFEIWRIPVALNSGDYIVRAKYGKVFDSVSEGYTMNVVIQERPVDLTVYSYTVDGEIFPNNAIATFTVITSRDISKIQFVDAETLDTLTYSIAYADYEDIVHADYGEVRLWTIERSVFGPGTTYQYDLRVKIDIRRIWNEDGGSVTFTVTD